MPRSQRKHSVLGNILGTAGASCVQWRMPGIEMIPFLVIAKSGESWD